MKTTDNYLNQYLNKTNELSQKDELWRLRVSQEEFLLKIKELRIYEIETRKSGHLNEYHIQKNIEGMIAVMLMNKVTIDEAKEQFERIQNCRSTSNQPKKINN